MNLPETVVNVNVPAPVVNIEVPSERKTTFERDAQGKLKSATTTEAI